MDQQGKTRGVRCGMKIIHGMSRLGMDGRCSLQQANSCMETRSSSTLLNSMITMRLMLSKKAIYM